MMQNASVQQGEVSREMAPQALIRDFRAQ